MSGLSRITSCRSRCPLLSGLDLLESRPLTRDDLRACRGDAAGGEDPALAALRGRRLPGGTALGDGALGAHLSGLLAPFPISTSVLAVFTQGHGGFAPLAVLLRNFLIGFYGFAAFCFVLAMALSAMSTAAAFGLATGAALTVQATILALRRTLVR